MEFLWKKIRKADARVRVVACWSTIPLSSPVLLISIINNNNNNIYNNNVYDKEHS